MPEVRDDQLPLGAGSGGHDVVAIPAASTIVLREHGSLEILLLHRHERSTFVPGAWVFPGGAVDEADRKLASSLRGDPLLDTMKICAIRELFEETGIWVGKEIADAARCREALLDGSRAFSSLCAAEELPLNRLVWTSRWITPDGVPKRFDTCFFLVEVAAATEATAEHSEATHVLWIAPSEALERHRRGELSMMFPTMRNLEAIAGFSTASDLLASRSGVDIAPIQPVLVIEGTRKRLVVPGEETP